MVIITTVVTMIPTMMIYKKQDRTNQIKSNHNNKGKDKYSSKLINTTPP